MKDDVPRHVTGMNLTRMLLIPLVIGGYGGSLKRCHILAIAAAGISVICVSTGYTYVRDGTQVFVKWKSADWSTHTNRRAASLKRKIKATKSKGKLTKSLDGETILCYG